MLGERDGRVLAARIRVVDQLLRGLLRPGHEGNLEKVRPLSRRSGDLLAKLRHIDRRVADPVAGSRQSV